MKIKMQVIRILPEGERHRLVKDNNGVNQLVKPNAGEILKTSAIELTPMEYQTEEKEISEQLEEMKRTKQEKKLLLWQMKTHPEKVSEFLKNKYSEGQFNIAAVNGYDNSPARMRSGLTYEYHVYLPMSPDLDSKRSEVKYVVSPEVIDSNGDSYFYHIPVYRNDNGKFFTDYGEEITGDGESRHQDGFLYALKELTDSRLNQKFSISNQSYTYLADFGMIKYGKINLEIIDVPVEKYLKGIKPEHEHESRSYVEKMFVKGVDEDGEASAKRKRAPLQTFPNAIDTDTKEPQSTDSEDSSDPGDSSGDKEKSESEETQTDNSSKPSGSSSSVSKPSGSSSSNSDSSDSQPSGSSSSSSGSSSSDSSSSDSDSSDSSDSNSSSSSDSDSSASDYQSPKRTTVSYTIQDGQRKGTLLGAIEWGQEWKIPDDKLEVMKKTMKENPDINFWQLIEMSGIKMKYHVTKTESATPRVDYTKAIPILQDNVLHVILIRLKGSENFTSVKMEEVGEKIQDEMRKNIKKGYLVGPENLDVPGAAVRRYQLPNVINDLPRISGATSWLNENEPTMKTIEKKILEKN